MTEPWPTFHDVPIAYKSCRLHKPASRSQIHFEARLGENLGNLFKEIHSDRYRPRPAKCFVVTHPKPREIFAADFKDRVVHHLITTKIEPIWEKKFIYSSFACRLGKGSYGAIKYVQHKVRKLSQGGIKHVWALQLDVEKFFVTIHRPILCELLLKHARKPKLRELIRIIYSHDARHGAKRVGNPSYFNLIPPGKSWFDQLPDQGVPIGNLTSQFGANVYLTGLDHFIQRHLKPNAYLRYMDDLLLLDHNPEKLIAMAHPINNWLVSNRLQRLNHDKTHLTNLSDGITYLGYRLRQVDSPTQPLQLFSEPMKKWKWISALKRLENAPISESERPHWLAPSLHGKAIMNALASLNSRLGAFVHARSYLLRKESLECLIKKTTTPHGIPSEFSDRWCPFRLKKGYRAIRLR